MKLLLTLGFIQFSSIIIGQAFPGLDSLLTIPFVEDTVHPSRNLFSHFKKIGAIENSQSDFELRIYPDMEWGSIFPMLVIIRSENKNFITSSYYTWHDTTTWRIRVSTIVDTDNNQLLFKWPQDKIKQPDDSFFAKAVNLGLLNIADQKKFVDSLRLNRVTLYDDMNNRSGVMRTDPPSGYDYLEIKLGNKIRSLRISHNATAYYWYNKEIPELKKWHDLYSHYSSYMILPL